MSPLDRSAPLGQLFPCPKHCPSCNRDFDSVALSPSPPGSPRVQALCGICITTAEARRADLSAPPRYSSPPPLRRLEEPRSLFEERLPSSPPSPLLAPGREPGED